MKKKILLAFILVAMLACMLAISVSAATTNAFGTPETGGVDLTNMAVDDDVYVVLYDGTEYHTYPAQYIVTNAKSITFDFAKINSAFGKEYDVTSIIRIQVPSHVTEFSGVFAYGKNRNVVEIEFPSDSSLTKFSYGTFETCEKLEKINIPATTSALGGHMFNGCSALTDVTFDAGFSMTSLPNSMFKACSSLKTVVIPNSVTTLNGGTFYSCTSIEKVVLGANLAQMGTDEFAGAGSGTNAVKLYAPASLFASLETIPNRVYTWDKNHMKNVTYYFTGTKAQAEAIISKAEFANIKNAKVVAWDKEKGENHADYVVSGSNVFVYGYNLCDAFYEGVHAASAEIKKAFLGQAFASDYKIYTECSRECGKENIIEQIGQLIHVKGYATSEIPGNKAMMHSYIVDKSLVSKYQELFADLKFGILAVGENTSSPFNGSLIDAQGNKAHEKIAMVEFTNRDFDEIEIKVGGIDGYEDRDLYFCGYVIGGENVYYIENDAIKTQAETVTYNDVCAILTGTGNEEENENV